jgi:RNA polymerase primary sigma factor
MRCRKAVQKKYFEMNERSEIEPVREGTIFEGITDIGKGQGILSCGDLNSAFPSEFISEDEIENLADILQDMGIEAMDMHETNVEEKEDSGEQEEYEKAEDLVQTYFQSMGDISVLSKEEETELARTIEEGNHTASI